MSRVAVFVDSGYLFAQGSHALSGQSVRREYISIDIPNVVAAIKKLTNSKCPGGSLLRIYWYDARPRTGHFPDHDNLASQDHIKLRLGTLNQAGQQKGVDSLIVTDLIELARNAAITDAVLLSGDEDLRVGVQLAQPFGVAVHLLGIVPASGSQSKLLRQEADTLSEWTKADLQGFMTVTSSSIATENTAGADPPRPPLQGANVTVEPAIRTSVEQVVNDIEMEERNRLFNLWAQGERMIPNHIDRILTANCADALNRPLTPPELHRVRQYFKVRVEQSIFSRR